MTNQPSRASRRDQAQRSLIVLYVAIGLIVVAFLVLMMQVVGPSPPKTITLAGGVPGGAYHAFAERYRQELEHEGITVEIRQTAGSIENLDLLHAGEVDVAFVQSGTADAVAGAEDRVHGIASLFYEPLWIFHEGERAFDDLAELRGKRLAIGGERSGTRCVVEKLLKLNGIDASNSELKALDMIPARDALRAGEVDFAFFTASPEAEVVRELMVDPQTRLVNIRRHQAYVRNVLFVTDVQIAEGTFDIRQNFPRMDLVVLSTVAQLLCAADLHPAVVEVLARTAEALHSGRTLLARGGTFPSPDNLEFAIHESASDYFRSGPSLLSRYLPFWLANLLKKLLVLLIPLITVLIPLLKIAPGAFKAVMRKRIHRHYKELERIEDLSDRASTAADLDECIRQLDELQHVIETQISVPTSYRMEEYNLRLHVGHVRQRLLAARADS